jgi:hypothetical protein
MRIYGGLDDIGLAATDRWRTVDAALRPRRRARRVAAREALPGVENPWKRASGDGK